MFIKTPKRSSSWTFSPYLILWPVLMRYEFVDRECKQSIVLPWFMLFTKVDKRYFFSCSTMKDKYIHFFTKKKTQYIEEEDFMKNESWHIWLEICSIYMQRNEIGPCDTTSSSHIQYPVFTAKDLGEEKKTRIWIISHKNKSWFLFLKSVGESRWIKPPTSFNPDQHNPYSNTPSNDYVLFNIWSPIVADVLWA